MVASNIQITQGSGTRLATSSYTEGAVTVHDEKVILGEQYLPEYRNPGSNTFISTATLDSHLMTINAGASLNVYVRRIRIYQVVAATTGANVFCQVLRTTTAAPTGGTAQSFAPLDTTAAASGATSMHLPTAKGTESTVVDSAVAYFNQTVGAVNQSAPTLLYDFDYRSLRGQALRIPAGVVNGIAVKNRVAVAGATVAIVCEITEASF